MAEIFLSEFEAHTAATATLWVYDFLLYIGPFWARKWDESDHFQLLLTLECNIISLLINMD